MKNKINLIVCLFAILLSSFVIYSQSANKIHSESLGGFKYVMPNGWNTVEIPEMKFKIAHGFTADGFTPNIVIDVELFDGSIDDYVHINLEQVIALIPDYKQMEKSDFITNTGMKGYRFIIESTQYGNYVRQFQYVFDGIDGKKLVVTCSSLAKDGNRFGDLFDASMKTFQIY